MVIDFLIDLLGSDLFGLGIIRLISFLQEQFHLEIAPNDITPENFDKIKSISEFMAKYNFLNTPN